MSDSERDTLEEDPGQTGFGAPEPWERWETTLCLGSAGIGIVALLLLGVAVNTWLL